MSATLTSILQLPSAIFKMLNHTTSSSDSLSSSNAASVTSSKRVGISLMLNPIQDPSYNTQSGITLSSMKILDSVHYDIDQLDHTTSTTASYYYTNYPPYQSTLSSKERHFGKLFKRKLFSYERRSPSEGDEMKRSPWPISRQNTSDYDDGASNVSRSYNEPDFAMGEVGGLQRLRTDDSMRRSDGYSPSSAAGQKIRVESPSQSKSGVIKVQNGFVCDCCPTKPKKFETEEALK